MLTALVLLCTIGTTDCRQIAESPEQSELPLCPLHTAWNPRPGGKFVKVACIHKGVLRIIQ